MTPAELEALVARAAPEAVRKAFRGLTEGERRALAPTAERLRRASWPFSYRPDESRGQAEVRERPHEAAMAAFLETAASAELMQTVLGRSDVVAVLTDRKPPWLRGWAAKAVEKDIHFWRHAYRLVKAGLADRPTSDNWCLGFLVHGQAHAATPGANNEIAGPETHLADPEFVKTELWRLFEIEGTRDHSFANIDRWGRGDGWSGAILEAARNKKLPRARLLDATLAALGRDFIQYRVAWFGKLHEALEPTIDERAARLDGYLALLTSRVPPTVTLALDALAALDAEDRLPAKALLAQIAPALQSRVKKQALAALALVDRAAEQRGFAARAALVAAEALAHENAEVQKRAFALVAARGDRGDGALAPRVRELAPSAAATLRPKIAAWLGDAAPGSKKVAPKAEASKAEPPKAAPATRATAPESPLARAASLDEAIELLSGAIERAESPDEMEGALAGVARFCGERPPDFAARVAPLAKRTAKLLEKNNYRRFHGDVHGDMCMLARSWSVADPLDPAGSDRNMETFLSGRIREVAVRAAHARPTTLLATPTQRDGWIDPDVLVARARDAAPDPLDAVQSFLRVAREGRPAALARAAGVGGEYGAALRFALGGDREQAPREPESDLWLAAEATRTGDNLWPRLDLLRYGMRLEASWDDRLFTRHETLRMRWVATVFPADLGSYFRSGGSAILAFLNDRHALWWNAVYLEPLLRHDVPMEKSARRLLAIALASGQPAEAGLATDVLIQIVDDGRANADELGDTFATLFAAEVVPWQRWGDSGFGNRVGVLQADKLPSGPMSCARWAKQLQDAARASARHAALVRDLVIRALRSLPTSPPPRDAGALLALLEELCAETGGAVRDAEARAKLEAISGSGKGGKVGSAARALLART
jgi:hypothetical protein